MIALSPKKTFEYILREDRGSKTPTVFILRALTALEVAELDDVIAKRARDEGYPAGTFNYLALRYGIVGWRNMADEKGAEVAFKVDPDGRMDDSCQLLFRPVQRLELANAIYENAHVTEDEAKN